MPHGSCPTVRVKADNPQGYIVINATDFDATAHERHVAPPPPPPAAPLPPPPPAGPLANLPADWKDKPTGWLRALAEQVNGGRTPENRKQAIEIIESKLPPR